MCAKVVRPVEDFNHICIVDFHIALYIEKWTPMFFKPRQALKHTRQRATATAWNYTTASLKY